MSMLKTGLLVALVVASPAGQAGTEHAIIPKFGYVAPANEQYGSMRHGAGTGQGVALEFRKIFGEAGCGFAIGPEVLDYEYEVTYENGQHGSTREFAMFVAPKLLCASANTRYSLGAGFGWTGNVSNGYSQAAAGAEFGWERVRIHTEARYWWAADEALSGYGAFVGVSFILKALR